MLVSVQDLPLVPPSCSSCGGCTNVATSSLVVVVYLEKEERGQKGHFSWFVSFSWLSPTLVCDFYLVGLLICSNQANQTSDWSMWLCE